jgi:nicotinamidase-related amidase
MKDVSQLVRSVSQSVLLSETDADYPDFRYAIDNKRSNHMLYTSDVPLTQSALLVIDAQDSFKMRPIWERRNNLNFESNVTALIEAYRAANLPIFYFLHTDDDPEFLKGTPGIKLMDFLAPRPTEEVIHKDTRNTFTSTNLQATLLHLGVRRLAVTGIQMEQCCETTTRVAADLGYAVDFVIDATMTFPIKNWDVPGQELDVKAIEERTTYALNRRFARVTTTQTLVAELEALSLVTER